MLDRWHEIFFLLVLGRRFERTLSVSRYDESTLLFHAAFDDFLFEIKARSGCVGNDHFSVTGFPSIQDDAGRIGRCGLEEREVGNRGGEVGVRIPFEQTPPTMRCAPGAPRLDAAGGLAPPAQPDGPKVVLHDVDPSRLDHVEEIGRWWTRFAVGNQCVEFLILHELLECFVERTIFRKSFFEPVDADVTASAHDIFGDIQRCAVVRVDENLGIGMGGLSHGVDHPHIAVGSLDDGHPSGTPPDFDLEVAVAVLVARRDLFAKDGVGLLIVRVQVVNVD